MKALLSSTSNGPPEYALALTAAVGVSGIEDGHAEVESLPNESYSVAPTAPEGYAAEAEVGQTGRLPRIGEPWRNRRPIQWS